MHDPVVQIVESRFVDQLERRSGRCCVPLRLLAPAFVCRYDSEVQRAHLPDCSVVRAQELEDAKLGRDHGQTRAPDLVSELVHLLQADLRAEHLEAPLLHFPRHHFVAVRDLPGQERNDVLLRLQLAPGNVG